MASTRRKDGFLGEKQINIPANILNRHIKKMPFLNSLYITHIGYFPNAQYHYRERMQGCEDYILFYCLGGKGHIDTPETKSILQANQYMILPPNEFHRYQADIANPWTIYWIHFSGSRLDELEQQFNLVKFKKPNDIHFSEEILQLWQEMYNSLEQGYGSANISFANLSLYRFISFFIFPDRKKLISKTNEESRNGPLDRSILFMKTNIASRLSVEEIAEKFEMSPSHYNSLFKKKTGMSPMDYFIRMKIQYACQMLSQSDLKIKDVGDKIGYDDPYYFSRIFKKVTGKSPSQYKEDH